MYGQNLAGDRAEDSSISHWNVNEPYCTYAHFAEDALFYQGYKRRIDRYCHRGCGQYSGRKFTLRKCPECAYEYCPPCWPEYIGLDVCLLCATQIPEYVMLYGTNKPNRIDPVHCIRNYKNPDVYFFKDSRGKLYCESGEWDDFTESERRAMFTMSRNSKYDYHFQVNRRDISCQLRNNKIVSFDTSTYQFQGQRFGLYQIHKGVQTMGKFQLLQDLLKHKIHPRMQKYHSLKNIKSPRRENVFYQYYDRLSTHISIQRMQLFGRKGWNICIGPKTDLYDSPMSNKGLFTEKSMSWNGWKQYKELVDDISNLAISVGAVEEQIMPTFYGKNLCLLCSNTTTFVGGSGMLSHRDISFPIKMVGFKTACIILVTLEVKNGVKTLTFQGDGRLGVGNMCINQRPGDITIMTPPSTTHFYHLVEPLQADYATNLQIRATFV